MGCNFVPLSTTPYGAVGKPFEDFLVLLANASEELGGLNYEQALALLHSNLAMTIQKANVDILLQAEAYSSSLHRPNQPRVDKDHTHHTQIESHDNPLQPTVQHPLLSMLNVKLPHTHSSIFIPQGETHTQVTRKFPLPGLPYNPSNFQALAFLDTLNLPPQPLSPPPPPSSPSSLIHQLPLFLRRPQILRCQIVPLHFYQPPEPTPPFLNPTPSNPQSPSLTNSAFPSPASSAPLSLPLSSPRNHLSLTIPATPTTPSYISSTSSPFLSPLDRAAPDNPLLPSSHFPPLNPPPDPHALSPSTTLTNSGLETTVGLKENANCATSTTTSFISPTSSPLLAAPGDPLSPSNPPSPLSHSSPNLAACSLIFWAARQFRVSKPTSFSHATLLQSASFSPEER
jgi:hypothetical protein